MASKARIALGAIFLSTFSFVIAETIGIAEIPTNFLGLAAATYFGTPLLAIVASFQRQRNAFLSKLASNAVGQDIDINWIKTAKGSDAHLEIIGNHEVSAVHKAIGHSVTTKFTAPDMNIYGPVSASELIEIVEKRQLSSRTPQDGLENYEPATNEQVVDELNQTNTEVPDKPQKPSKPSEIELATNASPAPRPSGLGASTKLAAQLATKTGANSHKMHI